MSDLDNTQREAAETVEKVRAVLDNARRQNEEADANIKGLLGVGIRELVEVSIAKLSSADQEKARLAIAVAKEETERDLRNLEVKRAVRVKPTRQMV
ncbi:hypothetical protein [Hyphomicrobium sp. MC1]|uniref:hypothetical protein n=1 Tax=Hyphomicrobium sp. (strain MC1) TaxID=717785 RepID=UPI000213F237|nr:hypothetical protein [Hyphomicrobium sp. MC1]CCB66716.1 protein of unknown function [Hyphomicrobium sp. MC1]